MSIQGCERQAAVRAVQMSVHDKSGVDEGDLVVHTRVRLKAWPPKACVAVAQHRVREIRRRTNKCYGSTGWQRAV